MKKYTLHGLLTVILMTIVGTVSADFPTETLYTGAAIGHSSTLGRNGLKRNAIIGELFTGYGQSWDKLYLGVEAYLKLPRNKVKSTIPTSYTPSGPNPRAPLTLRSITTTSAKFRKGEFGIDVRGGVLMSPSTMLYGRVGTALNRIYIDTITMFSYTPTRLVNSRKKNAPGLRLGGGMEHELASNLTLRVDYVYTTFKNINEDALQAPNLPAKINNHTTKLGVSYFW